MNWNAAKRKAATALDAAGINALGHKIQTTLLSPFIRAVNYHDIEREHAGNFEAHLRYFAKHFVNVTEESLVGFLGGERWGHERPGLILSFDDAMQSHFEIVAPLLENYGFTGWFFVPTSRLDDRHDPDDKEISSPESLHLSLEEVRTLDRRHVVGSHTQTHCRLSADVPDEKMNFEIRGSKRLLEEILGHEVKTFCWVGGEEFTYSSKAAAIVNGAYYLVFMTNSHVIRSKTNPMQLQRTNIEAENPLSLVCFQLSGIMDLFYTAKRRRVNRITS